MTLDHSITLDHELVSVEDEQTVHAMLELTAPAVDRCRPPLRLAVVLDRSGSMSGERLACAKTATRMLAQLLSADDQLGVVAYDDQVRVVAPLGKPSSQVLAAVEQLEAGRSTNLSGGWTKGCELLERAGDTRRVVLLTDGHANEGVTDPSRLAEMAGVAANGRISTTSIGIGAGFNEHLLAAMADRAGGGYFYADQPDDLPAAFEEAFGDLAALVASTVSVEIRPVGGVGFLGVLNDFPVDDVGEGLQVQVGELHAQQTRRVVWKLEIPAMAAMGPAKVADVVLRWTEVGERIAQHTTTLPLLVNVVSAEDAAARVPDARVTDEVVILSAARRAEQLRRKADDGDADAAAQGMTALAEELDAHAEHGGDRDRMRVDAQRYRAAAERLQRDDWSASASLQMHEALYREQRSRPQREGRQ